MEEAVLKSGTLWGPNTGSRKGVNNRKKEEYCKVEVKTENTKVHPQTEIESPHLYSQDELCRSFIIIQIPVAALRVRL
jgi:hypothetical protein